MKEQHARLQNIERSLLQRAEDIVPVNKDLMTAAELVQICQNLNRMNLDFARYLDPRITQRIFDAGVSKIYTTTQQMDISGRIESTGRDSRLANNEHLHSVAEADYETDATTTPGSTFVGDPSSALELMSTRCAATLGVLTEMNDDTMLHVKIREPVLSLTYIFSFTLHPHLNADYRTLLDLPL